MKDNLMKIISVIFAVFVLSMFFVGMTTPQPEPAALQPNDDLKFIELMSDCGSGKLYDKEIMDGLRGGDFEKVRVYGELRQVEFIHCGLKLDSMNLSSRMEKVAQQARLAFIEISLSGEALTHIYNIKDMKYAEKHTAHIVNATAHITEATRFYRLMTPGE